MLECAMNWNFSQWITQILLRFVSKKKKTTIFNFYRAKHNVVFYSQVYSIGRSVEGRQILGIKITADVGAQRPQLRPQVTDQL